MPDTMVSQNSQTTVTPQGNPRDTIQRALAASKLFGGAS